MKLVSLQSWLTHVSKSFHLDAGYFFRGGFWGTIQQSSGLISGLAVSYMFGHFTSKQVFGEYNLALSYISILTFFSLPGLDTSLVGAISMGYDGSLMHCVKQKIKFSSIGSVTFVALATYAAYSHQTQTSMLLILCAIFFPFLNGMSIYPAFLTGKRKFKELSLLFSFGSLIFLFLHGFTIFRFNTTISLILAYIAARILTDFVGLAYSSRFVKNNKIDPDVVKYGSFLTGVSILPWISGHIGGIVLASFLGVQSLAVYAVADKFLSAIQKNFVVFYKPVTAKLASQSKTEHMLTLKTHAWKFLLMGMFLAAVLYVSVPFLIRFFFTTKYEDSIVYGQLLSLALVPLPLTWILSDMVIFQKKHRAQILNSSLPHLLKIVLYFIFIPKFGIPALVWITLFDRYASPIIPLYSILRSRHKN